jgi:hypothetical protein
LSSRSFVNGVKRTLLTKKARNNLKNLKIKALQVRGFYLIYFVGGGWRNRTPTKAFGMPCDTISLIPLES